MSLGDMDWMTIEQYVACWDYIGMKTKTKGM